MQNSTHTSSTDAPFFETAVSILGDRRRRSAVAVLSDLGSPISLPELVREVATRNVESVPDDGPPGSTETVGAELHHVHLPKLAENGIVDYDAENNVVTAVRTDAIEPVAALLDE